MDSLYGPAWDAGHKGSGAAVAAVSSHPGRRFSELGGKTGTARQVSELRSSRSSSRGSRATGHNYRPLGGVLLLL